MGKMIRNTGMLMGLLMVSLASVGFSEEVVVNFDQGINSSTLLQSVNERSDDKFDRLPMPKATEMIPYGDVQVAITKDVVSAEQMNDKLVMLGELLHGIKAEDRVSFLGNLMFRDGKIASARFDLLPRNLSGKRATEIGAALFPASMHVSGDSAKAVPVSNLLDKLSPQTKLAFLDGLMLKNGEVVSLRTGEVAGELGRDAMLNIVKELSSRDELQSKNVCGDSYCDDAWCQGTPGNFNCEQKKGHTCKSSCK